MAKHRFKSLSVSEKVYEKLKEIAERRGFATIADTIAYLVTLDDEVYRRLEQLTITVTTSRGNVTTNSGNSTSVRGNVTTNSGNKPSKTAMDILRERKIVIETELSRIRNRDAFFNKLRSEGAVVLETAKGRIAILSEFWQEFREKLASITTNSEDKIKKILGNDHYRLFKILRESEEIYYDNIQQKWRFVEETREDIDLTDIDLNKILQNL